MQFVRYHVISNFPKGTPFTKKVFANIVYFVTGIIVHHRKNALTHRDLIKARLKLRKGDVVLAGNLRELSHFFIRGPFTHALLYVGRRRFIHAIADGVQYTSLHHVFTEYDTFCIVRLPRRMQRRRRTIREAIRHAQAQLGKPYDFEFSDDPNKFFCSELVNYVYKRAGHKTGLKTLKKFETLIEQVEKKISLAVKALHPIEFVRGNFDVVFFSHNLRWKKKDIVLV